jgi:hypothetical protein
MVGIGGPKHEEILDLIRFKVFPFARKKLPCLSALTDGLFMMPLLGYLPGEGSKKGVKYPDLLFIIDEDGKLSDDLLNGKARHKKYEMIVIEIGNYQPDKWISFTVIHVGINKIVSIVNPKGTYAENVLKETIRQVLLNPDAFDLNTLE